MKTSTNSSKQNTNELTEDAIKALSDKELVQLHDKKTSAICSAIKTFGKERKRELDKLLREGKLINKEIERRQAKEIAVTSLILWAKGTEPCYDKVQQSVDYWLEIYPANGSNNKEYIIAHRELAIDGLIISCIRECSSEELAKLDGIKHQLASTLPTYLKEKFDQLEMY